MYVRGRPYAQAVAEADQLWASPYHQTHPRWLGRRDGLGTPLAAATPSTLTAWPLPSAQVPLVPSQTYSSPFWIYRLPHCKPSDMALATATLLD